MSRRQGHSCVVLFDRWSLSTRPGSDVKRRRLPELGNMIQLLSTHTLAKELQESGTTADRGSIESSVWQISPFRCGHFFRSTGALITYLRFLVSSTPSKCPALKRTRGEVPPPHACGLYLDSGPSPLSDGQMFCSSSSCMKMVHLWASHRCTAGCMLPVLRTLPSPSVLREEVATRPRRWPFQHLPEQRNHDGKIRRTQPREQRHDTDVKGRTFE